MAEVRPVGRSPTAANFLLGRKLNRIAFSTHHAMVIAVLAPVGLSPFSSNLTVALHHPFDSVH